MVPDNFLPFFISLKTSFVSTILVSIVGIFLAYIFVNHKIPYKNFWDLIISLPLILPPTVLGYLLLIFLGKTSFIGSILNKFDITIIFSWWATVLTAFIVSLALMYQTTKSGFENIDPEIINAARTLGGTEFYTFRKIIFPLTKPSFIAGVLLSFSRALGEFGATLMFAGNIPGKTQTLSIAIYFAVASGNYEEALFWVLILVSISFFSILVLNVWKSRFNS